MRDNKSAFAMWAKSAYSAGNPGATADGARNARLLVNSMVNLRKRARAKTASEAAVFDMLSGGYSRD
jgi:hypothetical protein